MIDYSLIKWIINTLKHERQTLSQFSFEYMTALLMNLTLRSKGKEKCEEAVIYFPVNINFSDWRDSNPN
jgi:hypothetical protein